MTVPFRPLGLVREIVNAIGLDITYAYEDLVYVEHNAFLLQMSEVGEIVNLYFNTESEPGERDGITAQLQDAGRERGLNIVRKGLFSMRQKSDGENVEIRFLDEAE